MDIDPLAIFTKSCDIIARKMEEEFILVSVTGPGSTKEDNLYILNETGRIIWQLIDGRTSVAQLIDMMARQYKSGSNDEIRDDVQTLIKDLSIHKMIVQMEEGG
jgi:hypothetical protein